MALSAADELLVVNDTLRGLEANRIRAEILGVADDEQASRVDVIDQQIAAAEERVETLEQEAAADAEEVLEAARAAGVAAVETTDPATFTDDYDFLSKEGLLARMNLKGIAEQAKSDHNKADLILLLRADDLRHRGVVV